MPLMYIANNAMIVTMIAAAMMRSAPNLLILFIDPPRGPGRVSHIRLIQDSNRPLADNSF